MRAIIIGQINNLYGEDQNRNPNSNDSISNASTNPSDSSFVDASLSIITEY